MYQVTGIYLNCTNVCCDGGGFKTSVLSLEGLILD